MWGKRNRRMKNETINHDSDFDTQSSQTMPASCDEMEIEETITPAKKRPRAEHILQPDSFKVTRPIADELLQRRVVIIDFSKLAKEDRIRTIDFVTGVTYAHHGSFKKISNQIYKFELK